ncbi:MAG TPA: c-type cytochrome [Steroidobacteraceae bacterium]|nr:c-type cytochrome [Steroidobacteraceae bacterium]
MNKAAVPLIAIMVLASGGACAKGGAGAKGDAAAGRSKAAECAACHGPTGASTNSEWPNLAGQKYAYLIEQLQAFQHGTRRNPVMTPIARQLSAKDVGDLAAYFSALQGAAPAQSPHIAKASVDRGFSISSQCTACHGLTGMSPMSARAVAWPNLAGQKYAYLLQQLRVFKEGGRRNSLMSPMAQRLSAADARDIAAYFSAQPPVAPQASNSVGAAAGKPIPHPPIIQSPAFEAARPRPPASYWGQFWPKGKGRSIVEEKCTLCHDPQRIVAFVRPKQQWHDAVEAMRRRGSPVTQQDIPLVVSYLATYFGPDSPPNRKAQELRERHVAQRACTRSEWPRGSSDFRRDWKGPYNIWVSNMMGGSIDIVDPTSFKVVGQIKCISSPDRVEFSPDGNTAYVPDRVEHDITVIDTRTGAIETKIPLIARPNMSVISRDGKKVYAGIWPLDGRENKRGYFQEIDTAKLKIVRTVRVQGGIHDPWMSPDGKEVLMMSPEGRFMDLFDTRNDHLLWICCHEAEIGTMNMEAGPDGATSRIFFSYAGYPGIVVISARTGKELERVPYPVPTSGPYKGLAPASGNGKDLGFHGGEISPDGKTYWVMQGSWVREFALPSLKFTGEIRLSLDDQAGLAYRPIIEGSWLTISPDGRTVYAIRPGRDLLSAIDVKTMKEVAEVPTGEYPLHISIWPRGTP